jgi:hypothetical protein
MKWPFTKIFNECDELARKLRDALDCTNKGCEEERKSNQTRRELLLKEMWEVYSIRDKPLSLLGYTTFRDRLSLNTTRNYVENMI